MAFDINTAKVASETGFDINTAKTVKPNNIDRAKQRLVSREITPGQEILQNLAANSLSSKLVGGLQAVGVPFEIGEAVLANPILEARKSGGSLGGLTFISAQEDPFTKIANIPSSVLQALKRDRLGQFGDILTSLGANETTSKIGGLGIDLIIGGGLIEQAFKSFKKGLVNKSQRVALEGSRELLEGVDIASKKSIELTNQFWKQPVKVAGELKPIDDIPVNQVQLLELIDELPDKAQKILALELGDKLDVLVGPGVTLGTMRQIRQTLGNIRPSGFGKELDATLNDKILERSYSKVAKFITNTLKENGLSDKADDLLKVNDSAGEIIGAVKMVKNKLTSKKGEIKTGTALELLDSIKGASFEEKLKLLSGITPPAKKIIQSGLVKLRTLAAKEARKALFGQAIRGVGQAGLISAAFKLTGNRD